MPPKSRKAPSRAPARREDPPAGGNGEVAGQETPRGLEPFLNATPGSQAASIEWVRAAAQVRAAVMVAKEFKRDPDEAVADLRRACGQVEMARRAFYTYKRGTTTITGPTVQLAREAMRCWGNFDAGIWELERRPGWSEMMAWAQDLQTNSRFTSTFRVMHYRERGEDKGGTYLLDEDAVRDIYELNTNMAARRLREQIKAALPAWFMAIAENECRKTMIELGDDAGLEEFDKRVGMCVEGFASGRKFRPPVPEGALERKLGAPREAWTTHDLLTLRVLYEALARGELRVDAEFPDLAPAGGSADAALAAAATAKGDGEGESKQAPGDNPGPSPAGPAPSPLDEGGREDPGQPSAGEAAEARQVHADAILGLFRRAGWAAHTKAHDLVRRGMIILCLDDEGLEAPTEFDTVTLEGLDGEQVAAVLRRLSAFVAENDEEGDDRAPLHRAMGRAVQAAVDALGRKEEDR